MIKGFQYIIQHTYCSSQGKLNAKRINKGERKKQKNYINIPGKLKYTKGRQQMKEMRKGQNTLHFFYQSDSYCMYQYSVTPQNNWILTIPPPTVATTITTASDTE